MPTSQAQSTAPEASCLESSAGFGVRRVAGVPKPLIERQEVLLRPMGGLKLLFRTPQSLPVRVAVRKPLIGLVVSAQLPKKLRQFRLCLYMAALGGTS